VLGTIYYDPQLALSILIVDPGKLQVLFRNIFEKLKDMVVAFVICSIYLFIFFHFQEDSFTQRLIVLSFSSLMNVPIQTLPDIIRNNLQSMFQQVIRELVLIEEEEGKIEDDGNKYIKYSDFF
jgi:hypothetical protein